MYSLYEDEVNVSLGTVARILKERGYKSRRKNGAWDSSTISKILQNTLYVRADSILYTYLEIRQIKFLNDRSQWNGKTSCHIVGKRTGNSNIRKYTDFKEQSVYLTNFKPIIHSRTYITVMERLAKNEQMTSSNKPTILQELSGKLKCTCGYAIKSYSKSTTGRPYLDCYANRSLHSCTHKYNKFNFWDLQKDVGIEIQKQLDHLSDIVKTKRDTRKKMLDEIDLLQKRRDRLLDVASYSETMQDASIKKIEDIQKSIVELQHQLERNADIGDSIQISNFGIATINYSTCTMDEKKYIVNVLIDKIVLHEDTNQFEIFWNI
jgi:hypothetical protein